VTNKSSVVRCPLSVVGRSSAVNLRRTTHTGGTNQPPALPGVCSRGNPRQSRGLRRGVTLIELLVVILIISLLAGLVLGVAAVAGETARVQHSRHVVERLHTLLTDYYGTFKTRRVRLNPTTEADIRPGAQRNGFSGAKLGAALAEARLYAMREMMLMDVPDRWSDVILERVDDYSASAPVLAPIYLEGRTELSNVYLRRFRQIFGRTNELTGAVNTPEEIRRNQGAECLYMVITLATGDGEARTLFGENSIGDSDGDGAPEFLDGWKHPINFLRWAPGFDSQIQLNANTLINMGQSAASTAIAKDHDPFDLFRADQKAFRLVPLIYSPGRDEDSGIIAAPDYVTWLIPKKPKLNNSPPYLYPQLTPYDLTVNGLTDYLGAIEPAVPGASTDNIHNHLMGLR
jgi:prepilin-type N-terminal cleavage/methylation domain-containing protein